MIETWFWLIHLHALNKGTEVFHLCPKKKVTQLSIGKEDNEKHNGKPEDVLGTTCQRGGELGHCFVKANILEYLQEERTGTKLGQAIPHICAFLLRQEVHYSTKVPRRQPGWGKWWLSVQNICPRCATIFLWDDKYMTLFPVSKKNLKRDCYKDKCLEANEEPQVQCGFPPCQGVFVEMQSPCQQTSHCQFLGGHHERKTWFARLFSKILKW